MFWNNSPLSIKRANDRDLLFGRFGFGDTSSSSLPSLEYSNELLGWQYRGSCESRTEDSTMDGLNRLGTGMREKL